MNSFWTNKDFDVFYIDGLKNRMTALQDVVQPKFYQLGDYFSNVLSGHGTGEFFPHVAKHARRTVNPPTDSWVAFAPAKRGYKALPHFQIGLWGTHLFIVIAVIYENPNKKIIAERFKNNLQALTSLESDFIISGDHMKPEAERISDIGAEGVNKILNRLHDVKKAEFLVGKHLPRENAIKMSENEFFDYAENTIKDLLPIYDIITGR